MLAGSGCDKSAKFHLSLIRQTKPEGKKTNVYVVMKGGYAGGYKVPASERLGEIKWSGRWRQYVFHPGSDTMWSKGCLEIVNRFLDDKNKRYRMKWLKKSK